MWSNLHFRKIPLSVMWGMDGGKAKLEARRQVRSLLRTAVTIHIVCSIQDPSGSGRRRYLQNRRQKLGLW